MFWLLLILSQFDGTWNMWGAGPEHQGFQPMPGAINTPVIKWRFAPGGPVEWQFSAITDVDRDGNMEVIVGSGDNHIYCLAGSDGNQKWASNVMASIWSSPAVGDVDGDGNIEVLITSSALFCLSGLDGVEKWHASGNQFSSPNIADVDGDGNLEVLVGSGDYVVCYAGSDGTQKWSRYINNTVYASPAVADIDGDGDMEVVAIANQDTLVYCLSGINGSVEWTYAMAAGPSMYVSPAVADLDGDGTMEVVVGSIDNNIYCLRGSNGSKEWSYDVGMQINSSPAFADVDEDNVLEVVQGVGASLYCLDGATGSLEWKNNTSFSGGIITPGSLVDINDDGKLEFLVPQNSPNDGDTLYCVDATNGSVLWRIGLGSDVHTPFVGDIDLDGCSEIIVGTNGADEDGYRVFAIDDPDNSSNCGSLYGDVDETPTDKSLDLRMHNRAIYLFTPNQTQVSLELFDASGRLIQTLFNGVLTQGAHTFVPITRTKGVFTAVLTYPGGIKTLNLVR